MWWWPRWWWWWWWPQQLRLSLLAIQSRRVHTVATNVGRYQILLRTLMCVCLFLSICLWLSVLSVLSNIALNVDACLFECLDLATNKQMEKIKFCFTCLEYTFLMEWVANRRVCLLPDVYQVERHHGVHVNVPTQLHISDSNFKSLDLSKQYRGDVTLVNTNEYLCLIQLKASIGCWAHNIYNQLDGKAQISVR